MKASILSVALMFCCCFTVFSEGTGKQDRIAVAVASMKTWLAVIDTGRYAESWESTGKTFKVHVSDSQWVDALNKTRKPLGTILSRKKKTVEHTTALPGVPDGDYVVVLFTTSFTNKKKAVETVTASFEDNAWKVVGYYIK
ncbi:MAG: DUF4019 domain-containing protein [Chitinispirillaceae bacterium]|nr:DUF4019 domain-containing protein [Chitinispirillaceae bacterium]